MSLVLERRTTETPVLELVTPGGVRAYLVQDTSLPFISMAFQFAGGAAQDPAGKGGLTAMLASLLDEGAGDIPSQAFHELLEDNAIRLHFDADRDALSGTLKTLNATRDLAFDLLRQALTAPRFDPEPVERVHGQTLAELRRRETNPNYVASRAWFEHAFAGHAYAVPTSGTPESVAGVTVEDLRTAAGRGLARDKLSIGVAGDIDPDELAALLDATFGELPAEQGLVAVPRVVPEVGRTVVIDMPLPQSVVTFGRGGIGRDDPDYYGAYLANYVLGGGGFSSRLMQEIREVRGLAYGVSSHLYDADRSPLWIGGVATKNEQVAQSIALVRAEAARLAGGDLGLEELGHAKTYLTGSFALRLTNNDQIARMLLTMMAKDLGRDHLIQRNRRIDALTLDDVKRAAARLLTGDLLVTVVGAPVGLDE